MSADFVWRDAGRVVVFRQGGAEQAPQLLAEHGFERFDLLSTPRALAGAESLAEAASSVHEVPAGAVPDIAAALLDTVGDGDLVALGGGRTIDTAKAIASVTGARVAAIPTTMSGAEMTAIHRLPAGAENQPRGPLLYRYGTQRRPTASGGGMVRPELVIADPPQMTSQPEAQLRASSMNALAHGADSLYTPFANPLSQMAALRGAELIGAALDQEPVDRDRASLALGSILCGYAIDSGAFGIHHVVCQTLVRICGSPHAETNAAVLPQAMAYLVPRAPDGLAPLADSLGVSPERVGARIRELGGEAAGLGALGADRSELDRALDSMLARPELAFTPGPPTREDLEELVEAAW